MVKGHKEKVDALAAHPKQAGLFATGSHGDHVYLWDAQKKQLLAKKALKGYEITSVCFNPAGDRLAVGTVTRGTRTRTRTLTLTPTPTLTLTLTLTRSRGASSSSCSTTTIQTPRRRAPSIGSGSAASRRPPCLRSPIGKPQRARTLECHRELEP